MDLWRSMTGMVHLELTSADPADTLRLIQNAGIQVFEASIGEDLLTLDLHIRRQDRKGMENLAERKGYTLRYTQKQGLYWTFYGLIKRPVLFFGIVVLFLMALYIPSRVFFVRVEGNTTVPVKLILEKSEECGIYFGASRRAVRSEQVKNALLEAIPELQWAGVNTYGCVAVITVRQRAEEGSNNISGNSVSSITALYDGMITRCTVTQGRQLCQVGQAVRAGQLLVSGYTDCGICIKAGPSKAEIYAMTQRKVNAVTPVEWKKQDESSVLEKKYALIIGKKRINLYKGSGISGDSCDKMYSQYYVTLPGGFLLPISIVTETCVIGSTSDAQIGQEEAAAVLQEFSQRYLPGLMQAGQILASQESIFCDQSMARLYGIYDCEEMIAQVQSEEIIKPDGKYNGTDR